MYQTKSHQSLRASLLVGVASATVMAFAGTAVAQEPAEVVVVTGSRLPQANLTTVSPVTTISAADITNSGQTRIEDIVNQLPQAFAAQNATVSNGATGTATLNLRGLGEQRTLVLVDGRRMPYGSPFSPAADINEIPGIMVERVEVLTGGASAVYGSDAIAGVVNFIMRKDFEGVQIDLGYDFYWHNNNYNGPGALRAVIACRGNSSFDPSCGPPTLNPAVPFGNPANFRLPNDTYTDGDGHEESIIMGVNSANGKGNITAYFTHRKSKPLLQGNRDYSSCSLSASLPPAVTLDGKRVNHFNCGGSATSNPGYFLAYATDFSSYYGPFTIDGGAVGPGGHHNQFRGFNSGSDLYNFGPLNYYQRPDERYSFGANGHYEVASYADVYGSLMFTDYSTRSQIAPSGDFFSTNTLNCGNPLLSLQEADSLGCDAAKRLANTTIPFYVARRNVEGGGRTDDLHYSSWRVNGGVRGPISDHWSYDLNAQVARVSLSETYLNDFSVTRLGRALNVVSVGGVPTCQSVVDGTDPNCVPWNIFTIGGVTRDQLNYLQIPLLRRATLDQQILNLTFTGDLPYFTSPWATNDMQLAFGAEYRYDRLDNQTDVAFQTGEGAGQGGPSLPLSGAIDVVEVFMETRIPIVEDATFMKELSFEGAYRNSHYSTGVETDTYKIAGNWSPTEDFRIRVAYQRAIRAPNVLELFSSQGIGLFDMAQDPCGSNPVTGSGPTASLTDCKATPGAGSAPWYGAVGLFSPAGQYNFLGGGSPDLGPETANTWTYGVVLTPAFINGFTASVDYFDIEVLGAVGAFPESVLTSCYDGHDPLACSQIHRNALGSLFRSGGFVTALNENLGSLVTKGVDINVNYRTEIMEGWGALSVNLVGTWLDELSTDLGSGHPFDCVGFFSKGPDITKVGDCGTPNPEWRHRLRVAWEIPIEEWSPVVSVSWRRYSAVDLYRGIPGRLGNHFPAENYFDIGLTAEIYTGTSFRFGINNVFDKDPPISGLVGTTGNGNTYPQTYDAFGRYVFAGVTINL